MVSAFEPRSSCSARLQHLRQDALLCVQEGWEGVSVQWTSISSKAATETGNEPWPDGPLGS